MLIMLILETEGDALMHYIYLYVFVLSDNIEGDCSSSTEYQVTRGSLHKSMLFIHSQLWIFCVSACLLHGHNMWPCPTIVWPNLKI